MTKMRQRLAATATAGTVIIIIIIMSGRTFGPSFSIRYDDGGDGDGDDVDEDVVPEIPRDFTAMGNGGANVSASKLRLAFLRGFQGKITEEGIEEKRDASQFEASVGIDVVGLRRRWRRR